MSLFRSLRSLRAVTDPCFYQIRSYSSKPLSGFSGNLPFDQDHLKGDDEYNEFNNFYSDLFTPEEPKASTQVKSNNASSTSELDDLNQEMAELYGVESMEDQPTQSSPSSSEFQPPQELEALYNHQSQSQQPPKKKNKKKIQQQEPKLSLFERLQTPKPKIILTPTNTPHLNLSLEEYVFNNTPLSKPFTNHTLMFYINTPCVVVGKNQNSWKEANVPIVQNLGIPLLRRFSGGGTVVHDMGNVNYSYISTRQDFDRNYFGSVIKGCIDGVKQNERGDLLTEEGGLKISGSAYKIAKGKSLHHGTMLLNSNLEVLSKLLSRKGLEAAEVKCQYSVDSVRVKVDNLGLQNEDFIENLALGFTDIHDQVDIIEVTDEDISELKKLKEFQTIEDRLTSWDWVYGNTPKFSFDVTKDDLTVTFNIEKGLLKSFELNEEKHIDDFKFLQQVLDSGETVHFKGSEIAGFILNDDLSDFIGQKIDGSS